MVPGGGRGPVRGHDHVTALRPRRSGARGCGLQYELSYTLTASVHHQNAEGLFAQITIEDAGASIQQPPSTKWLRQSLTVGHIYLLQTLDTLNETLRLGFDERLKSAEADCHRIWDHAQASP